MKESKENWTDEEIIFELCHMFCKEKKYQFPGYTEDDIYQEAYIIAITAYETYDKNGAASLFTYLYRCIANRLFNLKRDKYSRNGQCSNVSKLVHEAEELDKQIIYGDNFFDYETIFEELDKRIPFDLREDWIRMQERCQVGIVKKQKILAIIKDFLEESGA